MEKIGIITDSASDLNVDQINKKLVKILPFQVIFKEGSFEDGLTITPQETYERMVKGDIPTTSLPQGKFITEALDYFKDNGFTHVIGIFISSKLSGCFNSFNNFARDYEEELTILSIDSKNLSAAEGNLVLLAQKLIGDHVSFQEIGQRLTEYNKHQHTYFVLDTLDYLVKGGRVGKVMGTLGQMLHIIPLIHVHEDGFFHNIAKTRGKKSTIIKLLELIKREYLAKGPIRINIVNGGVPEEAELFESQLKKLPGVSIAWGGQISPALGTHTGPGLLGCIIDCNENPL